MQKPAHTRSILTINAGADVPEALLLLLCKENPSALGVCVRDGSKIEYEKHGTPENPMEDSPEKLFTMVKTILRSQKKYPRMLVFHSMPQEFDEGEIQPYFIKDARGKPVMAVAFEGDFPGRELDGSSEMFGLMQEYLGPKLDDAFRFCQNQPNKLINFLKADSFANDLKNTCSHRAEFVFFPNEGEPFGVSHFEKGFTPLSLKKDWGTVSNAYGHTEAVIEPEPAPLPAPVSKSKFAPSAEDEAPAPAKVDDNGIHHIQEPKPEIPVPQVDPKPVTDPVHKAADATVEGQWHTPPATLHGKDLKKWYRQMNYTAGEMDADGRQGALPADWDKRPRLLVKTKTVAKSMAELGQTAIGTTVKEGAHLPVIDGNEQAKITGWIKKFTSDKVIDNPLELQKQEGKLALFSELCLTKGLDEINNWTSKTFSELCNISPDGAMLLLIELRRKVINLTASLKAGDKKMGELTGTQHTPAAAPVSEPLTPSPDKVVHAPKKISKYA